MSRNGQTTTMIPATSQEAASLMRQLAAKLVELSNELDASPPKPAKKSRRRAPRPGTKAAKALALLTREKGALRSTIRRFHRGPSIRLLAEHYGYSVRKVRRNGRIRYWAF